MLNNSKSTKGGRWGHCLRRSIHLAMAIIPVIYYFWRSDFEKYLEIHLLAIMGFVVLMILLFEIIRLWRGWIVIGQRHYEERQLSALAWGAFAIVVVLVLAPFVGKHGAGIGLPLIWSMSFVDPITGELRSRKVSRFVQVCVSVLLVFVIWLIASAWLGTPFWLAFMMAPITVLAEIPKLKWIDDNAMMLLVPLGFILIADYLVPSTLGVSQTSF